MTQDERRAAFVAEAVALFEQDGFQVADLSALVVKSMEYVGTYEGWAGADKKKEAIQVIDEVLKHFDLPGPDALVRPVIMMFVPGIIDKLVDATKDKFKF